jgi:hypothetical protein
VASTFLYPPTAIEFISGWFVVLFTWIVVIGLVNTIWGVRTTPIVIVSSAKLQLKFLIVETPPNLLSNFAIDPISTPLLTTSMLGATIVSTPVVTISTSSD